ncbi:MAG: DNA sulfur modification protein DndD [Microcoleus sp. PH2017_29_MFU_D_A]|uniref:DNA sulfur modification protein DndD n=1 Tax=unclassified Microcoleus TaxID=2642155 RepID=UPI001DF931E5|nr:MULTISPECIES: DNA sulfur modification protein DndD [unclassified Microcoleus]MCC3430561.1 DNA sulfur modification protein DndD [Microcoleus sp. PH2017_04_SCI_O_A]MCC3443757.1 DNA sulfur modification protein DndD [Microcoleus sp. PH2017_03_ELD_O_A]MCC3505079.1 DNA sulfur modification protein DndD [Microcoleus sp. PH2017_19_SFW_U_A]TAE10930.1 MAG: DNA sulfur modification protein DndD [Oscillatoriales cyanobacterium]MCC3411996.1 DNA sulfur modification protein DndD [Microcoleus sp. PH2017_02_F
MQFLELVLKNFGPYAGTQTINLRPEKDGNPCPVILFGGMNGGGKTTLMDAIRLALYGGRAQCSTRGNLSYSDFINQCVNRHTPPLEETRVELTFEQVQDDQLTQFKIVRYWKKPDIKDTLSILIYSEIVKDWWSDKAITNTWDEYIETLLPVGISNLFLFDGEQVKELAELETPPEFVVGAIKSLLGLELAERLAVDLEILAGRKRKEIAGKKDLAALEKIEATFQEISNKKQFATEEQASLKNKLEKAQTNQQKASDKFIYQGGKIAGDRSQLDRQLNDYRNQADKTRLAMMELASNMLPLALISPLLTAAKTQAETEASQQQAKIAQNVIKQRSDRLLNYIAEISLNPQQLDKIQDFIREEDRELEQQAATDAPPWMNADNSNIQQLENLLGYQIKAEETLVAQQIAEITHIETEIDFTDRQLAAAASPEAYEKLEEEVRNAQKAVAIAAAALESANSRIAELDKELAKTQKQLESYSSEYITIRNSQHVIASIAKAQNTLKLFKEKLTLKKLNKLEIEITDCFRYLLHKSDLVHRVAIDTDTFSLSIYDPEGKPVPKHRLSAGEKQLLAIAFLWGLARVSGRQLPVAIDTPLGRLDSSHRNNLVERYFPSASHQVILLSTDTEIRQAEYDKLQELEAIAHSYLLNYDSTKRQTTVETGYFWA